MDDRLPRLVVIGKVPVIPFDRTGSLRATYQALAPSCERIDIVAVADGCEATEYHEGNIHVHAGPSLPGLAGHTSFYRYAVGVCERLQREQGTDVYWLSDPLDSAVVAARLRRRFATPVVLHVQADMFALSTTRFGPLQRWLMATMTGWAGRRATKVRVVAQHLADGLVAAGLPRDKLVVIPPRTDLSCFQLDQHRDAGLLLRRSWGWPEDVCVVLHVGAFNASKGIDLLLEAAAQVRDEAPSLRYVLVGDGELRVAMEAAAARTGLEDRVRFCGFVPYESLPVWYAAADAGIVSSRDEGIGRGGIQAAAMSRPVIMTDVGGNREVLQSGVTGWLVPATAAGLASGLRELAARTPEERAAMGAAGRAFLGPLYDFDANIAALAELLWL